MISSCVSLQRTTFRTEDNNLPLPLPHLVFSNLVERWEKHTSCRLRELPRHQVEAFIRYHIRISFHKIQTTYYLIKEGGQIGFTGDVKFRARARKQNSREKRQRIGNTSTARIRLVRANHEFARGLRVLWRRRKQNDIRHGLDPSVIDPSFLHTGRKWRSSALRRDSARSGGGKTVFHP